MTKSLLVVDGEQLLAGAMADYLGQYGYSVAIKNSGEEALRLIDSEPPDIVLLEYRLPRKDGLEVLRRITAARPEIEVILRSAHRVGMSRETLRCRI